MRNGTGGFVAGTRLLCGDGMIPVEFIEIGERMITRDAGMVRVKEINRTVVETHFVRLRPRVLDERSPIFEMLLPQDQIVLVRDWRAKEIFSADQVLVEAKALVDKFFIEMTEKRREVLFQISFLSPHILYAEGVEVRSTDSVRARSNVLRPAE